LKYSNDILDRATAESMAKAFGELLKTVVGNPQVRIADLSLVNAEEGSEREEITF